MTRPTLEELREAANKLLNHLDHPKPGLPPAMHDFTWIMSMVAALHAALDLLAEAQRDTERLEAFIESARKGSAWALDYDDERFRVGVVAAGVAVTPFSDDPRVAIDAAREGKP